MNNLGFKFSTDAGKSIETIRKLGNGFQKLNPQLGGAYKNIHKLNMQFGNLSKDANRANRSLGALGKTGRMLIGIFGAYGLGSALRQSISSAMDMIETINLFSVSLGDVAVETNNALKSMQEMTGLDVTNMQNSVGTYALLARSMGMTIEQAQLLSTTTYRLGLDLASLTNIPVQQVMQDLRSGLVGQSETVYKYGVDVTEASIKTEAMRQGIEKSVRNMSQGEKMALRYSVMIRQTSLAQGDFARTIEQPANQMRILTERMTTLARSIGTMFIPMLGRVLPYANAIVKVLTNIINKLAVLFGYTGEDVWNTSGSIGSATEGVEDNLDGANDSAKKLKGQLMGFDEINLWNEPESGSGAGGAGAIAGDFGDWELPTYDSMFGDIKQKSDELVEGIENGLERIKIALKPTTDAFKNLWDNGISLLVGASFGAVESFYNNFLVPVGSWLLGEGLPSLFNIINDFITKINWSKISDGIKSIWDSLAPFAISVGEGLLWFLETVLVPLGLWLINDVLPVGFDLIRKAIDKLNDSSGSYKEVLRFLWEDVLIPVSKFLVGAFILAWNTAGDVIRWLNENVIKPIINILTILWENVLLPISSILIDSFGVAFETAGSMISSVWENVLTPLYEFFKDTFIGILNLVKETLDFWSPTISGLSDMFKGLWQNVLKPLVTFFTDVLVADFRKGMETIGIMIDLLKDIFSGLIMFVTGALTLDWKKAMYGLANIFIGIVNAIVAGFESMINFIIRGLNALIEFGNSFGLSIKTVSEVSFQKIQKLVVEEPKIGGMANLSMGNIQAFASGGIPNYGQMFIAREAGAELVGGFGSKTGVMNNEQIVEAVSAGVYQAVASAMQISNAGNSNDRPLVLNIDGKEFARMMLPTMDKETSRMGFKPILQR